MTDTLPGAVNTYSHILRKKPTFFLFVRNIVRSVLNSLVFKIIIFFFPISTLPRDRNVLSQRDCGKKKNVLTFLHGGRPRVDQADVAASGRCCVYSNIQLRLRTRLGSSFVSCGQRPTRDGRARRVRRTAAPRGRVQRRRRRNDDRRAAVHQTGESGGGGLRVNYIIIFCISAFSSS